MAIENRPHPNRTRPPSLTHPHLLDVTPNQHPNKKSSAKNHPQKSPTKSTRPPAWAAAGQALRGKGCVLPEAPRTPVCGFPDTLREGPKCFGLGKKASRLTYSVPCGRGPLARGRAKPGPAKTSQARPRRTYESTRFSRRGRSFHQVHSTTPPAWFLAIVGPSGFQKKNINFC